MMKRLVVILAVSSLAAPAFGQLAGYWNFNEGSGTTAADSSGKGKNGVLQKNGSDYPLWITGHDGTGGALRFNTTTTSSANSNKVFVDISTSDALASLGGAFTFSMWVRSDQIDDWVLRVPTGNWRWLVYCNAYDFSLALDPNTVVSDNQDAWDWFSSDLTSAWNGIAFPAYWEDWGQNYTGYWYHLAITYDGNYLKKYINGYLILAIEAPAGTLATATSDLYFASMGDGTGYFAGDLDDIAIWAGSYLPDTEITKLASDSATPLTVIEHAPEPPLPPMNYVVEGDMAWTLGGAKTLESPSVNWDIRLTPNAAKTFWIAEAWWFSGSIATPGSRVAVWEWNKWVPANLTNDGNIYDGTHPSFDAKTHGIEWISPSWSGVSDPNTAKFAAYITPGIAICQKNRWFQPYDPSPTRAIGWENHPYWKAYARVAGIHSQGASLRVRVYSYDDPNSNMWTEPLYEPNILTLIGEVTLPLSGVDYQWQELKFLLPKAPTIGGSEGGNWWKTSQWFEASVVSNDANTVLYIDEFSSISDRDPNFLLGDCDFDTHVNINDLNVLADEWVRNDSLEPRTGGMLVNGDFYSYIGLLNMNDDYSWVSATPTGWTFTGTADKGIQNMSKRGYMNFGSSAVSTPMAGSVAAYIISDAVLQQTTSATMVAGHTYYAMAYVMTSSWQGWKDTATLTLQANDVNLASFDRILSIERWRPVYGTYTATPSDAGKPIKIKLSYTNTHTVEDPNPGYMFIGYAYLGDTMPNEWPDKRSNLLVNGGFEDLNEVNNISPTLYHSLTAADNYGGWFTSSIHPATPGWVYEVPSGYDFTNKAGLWSNGFYGSVLPTPGMHDIGIYLKNGMIMGQVVGPLTASTTYYLDAACGINSGRYVLPVSDANGINWPRPYPHFRLELWRIPAGVTDGTVIYNAIAGGNQSYVKVAEVNTVATGDIAGGLDGRHTPASKWQLIGTSYTATSSDNNMYVRIRGTGGADIYPEFAFTDVYLSTAKRQIAGGETSFNVTPGMQYDVIGPYDKYHTVVMDLYGADVDGNGVVNFLDFVYVANTWLQDSFNDASGATNN